MFLQVRDQIGYRFPTKRFLQDLSEAKKQIICQHFHINYVTSAIPVNRDFNEKKFKRLSKLFDRAVVVIKWSECLPSIPKIRVRIPLKSTIFCKIVVKKEENFW